MLAGDVHWEVQNQQDRQVASYLAIVKHFVTSVCEKCCISKPYLLTYLLTKCPAKGKGNVYQSYQERRRQSQPARQAHNPPINLKYTSNGNGWG